MDKNLFESQIQNQLCHLAYHKILGLTESLLPSSGAVQLDMKQMTDRTIGRIAIVNRIRNGQVQLNKKVDVMGKGYKLLPNGLVVRMSPQEIRNRAKAAKIAEKKRKMEMFQILRNRAMSELKRNLYIGD